MPKASFELSDMKANGKERQVIVQDDVHDGATPGKQNAAVDSTYEEVVPPGLMSEGTTPGENGLDNKAFVHDEQYEEHTHKDVKISIYEDDGEDVEEAMFEELIEDGGTSCLQNLEKLQSAISSFLNSHNKKLWLALYALLTAAYAAYFGYAMWYQFGDEGSIRLLWVSCLVTAGVLLSVILDRWGDGLYRTCIHPVSVLIERRGRYIRWIIGVAAVCGVVAVLILEVALKQPRNLYSGIGIIVYVSLLWIFSKNPARVKWRPVLVGLLLQFTFALLILRTRWGFEIFNWLGARVAEFLAHTEAGAKFVFVNLEPHYFAFGILPIVVFFSSCVSVLFYLGAMQWLIGKVAWVMRVAMGTTAAESMNAAANIFIGQSEAPLVIRPFLAKMTRSELHAVMTGGYATIAGSVLGAFIAFGVPANHLLSASVMSAPAALAMAKLFYPETRVSITTMADIKNIEKSPERNALQAASNGASNSVKLVANIAVNLIAFLALLDFVNGTLTWMGNRVGLEKLTVQIICSYVLWPFAFVMGTDTVDCRKVAELIGIKTLVNEFAAYEELGVLINNRKVYNTYNGTVIENGDDLFLEGINKTLIGGVLMERSEVISTYALCGFANFSSIGIMLGAFAAMAPRRKSDCAKVVVRAMIAGNVASFTTACIAGLFYEPSLG
ncbi:solute carrier family 28 member 3 [Lingula anatina]|uniref:Sodium/nucleoside cotransporter n=1 Tax=Lingula anatina TaxID=7574 RepID=A0A1S3HW29_LINAN|nr:solute carrier family 28 member 3 [Lingula anatina]|eukprot:XP_013390240.1 solute carrier family 28 member 3 [Lingula anatina]